MATIGFPVMFYLLFGLSFGNRGGGLKASEYLLAGYAVFGVDHARRCSPSAPASRTSARRAGCC